MNERRYDSKVFGGRTVRAGGGWVIGLLLLLVSIASAQTKPGGTSGASPAGPIPPTCSGDATNLFYPWDGSETLVPFDPDPHNDDDSVSVALPFTFDFYGVAYTELYVNNNGNISFGSPFSTYSASGFPVAGFPMIAPFWGDVDTGNAGNQVGDVWMKFVDSDGDTIDDTLVVTWDNVGYYNEQGDLRNTFQVAITDGDNPLVGPGKNVAFSYDNMCWTTGSASGGSGGFGGTPATAGVNRGDGVDYFLIGRFDHDGVDYDGPDGVADGISYLDGQLFCFNVSGLNTPPIAGGLPTGNYVIVDAGLGEIVDLDLSFLSPEAGQTTTVTLDDPDGAEAAGLSVAIADGNTATVTLDWAPDCDDAGVYTLTFVATDDYAPPGVTGTTITIEVICDTPDGFVRGDFDGSGGLSIADQVMAIQLICGGSLLPIDCTGATDLDAGDANDNEYLTIADVLAIGDAVFGGGTLDGPTSCGLDPDDDTGGFDVIDPDYRISIADLTILPPGGLVDRTVIAPLLIDAPGPVTALTIILEHAPSLVPSVSNFVVPIAGDACTYPDGDRRIITIHNNGAPIITGTPGTWLNVANLFFELDDFAVFPPMSWVAEVTIGGRVVRATVVDENFNDHHPELVVGEYEFARGNSNNDESVNIGDPIFTLNYLFVAGPAPSCHDAADANNDGAIDIADPIFTLNYLFIGGPPPPAPFPQCGLDTGSIDALGCADCSCPPYDAGDPCF